MVRNYAYPYSQAASVGYSDYRGSFVTIETAIVERSSTIESYRQPPPKKNGNDCQRARPRN
jgi:hypothetical protein